MENEVSIQLGFVRRINLGNFNHKEYNIILNGTETQIKSQLEEKKAELMQYAQILENIVDGANELSKIQVVKEKLDVGATNDGKS